MSAPLSKRRHLSGGGRAWLSLRRLPLFCSAASSISSQRASAFGATTSRWVGRGYHKLRVLDRNHAGTLISAILLITRQKWRTSINRAAEAMTLFAVICAAITPATSVAYGWRGSWLGAELEWNLAEFSQPAALGCLRSRHLFHRVGSVLVYRADSRSCHIARPRENEDSQIRLWDSCFRLARDQPLPTGLPHSCGPFDSAGALGPLRRVLRFRHLGYSGLAPRSFRHLCCGRNFQASPWCSPS